MRITNLEIYNFRGIKKSIINFPLETRVLCLIGAGDNTKSTLLKSIDWLLWPNWNLTACDNDFYKGDTSDPILIRGTFTEIPSKLQSEDKFGLYLRCHNVLLEQGVDDEPKDDMPICLTIQLTIDDTLEPKWHVVCNRLEPKSISHNDRKLMQVGVIGDNCSRDMLWGKSSVLQKYVDSSGVLHEAYTKVLREAINNAELKSLDSVSDVLLTVGQQYGVGFNSDIRNKILMHNGSFSTTVGVFDGEVPLTQKGKGSQRLLSIGLNIQSCEGSPLLLIDEVETGLEPYRLKSLIAELRAICEGSGQVIMTTHSPVALTECTTQEIMVIRSHNGETSAYRLYSTDKTTNDLFQRTLRSNAEAFLSKRIIVCEGRTEIGFIRALDRFIYQNLNCRMAFQGIGIADGGGQSIFKCAKILINCGYEICLLMDSDLSDEEIEKSNLRVNGVSVFDWEQGNAFEEQIFQDAPMELVDEFINIAVNEKGYDHVMAKVNGIGIAISFSVDKLILPPISDVTIRKNIGTIAKAKKCEWFKRIDLGERIGIAIFRHWNSIDCKTQLKTTVNNIINWVMKHDE